MKTGYKFNLPNVKVSTFEIRQKPLYYHIKKWGFNPAMSCPFKKLIKYTPTAYWLTCFLIIISYFIITPFTPDLDIQISSYFYQNGSFSKEPLWRFFYDYGLIPAWITAFIALIFLFKKKWIYLQYLLTFALGAGLITQVLLKTFWPRPRPLQTDYFGGFAPYYPFWEKAPFSLEPMKSMPCGHCTLGFVFIALIYMGSSYQNRKLTFLGILLTIILGIGLSVARIAQGGHYFSDTLNAALIMWISAVIIDLIIKRYLYKFNKTSFKTTDKEVRHK